MRWVLATPLPMLIIARITAMHPATIRPIPILNNSNKQRPRDINRRRAPINLPMQPTHNNIRYNRSRKSHCHTLAGGIATSTFARRLLHCLVNFPRIDSTRSLRFVILSIALELAKIFSSNSLPSLSFKTRHSDCLTVWHSSGLRSLPSLVAGDSRTMVRQLQSVQWLGRDTDSVGSH